MVISSIPNSTFLLSSEFRFTFGSPSGCFCYRCFLLFALSLLKTFFMFPTFDRPTLRRDSLMPVSPDPAPSQFDAYHGPTNGFCLSLSPFWAILFAPAVSSVRGESLYPQVFSAFSLRPRPASPSLWTQQCTHLCAFRVGPFPCISGSPVRNLALTIFHFLVRKFFMSTVCAPFFVN